MPSPKPTDKIYGTEEAIAQGLLRLWESKNFKIHSDLDDEEILNLSLLYSLGDTTGVKNINKFCDNFLQLRVSRFRLGRREIVTIGSASGADSGDRKKARSIKDLFSGLR